MNKKKLKFGGGIMDRKELLRLIKPVSGSGKFSTNLYRWIRKNEHYDRVLLKPESDVVDFPNEKNCDSIIYLGFTDKEWLHGRHLSSIISDCKAQTYAFPGLGRKVKDITEKFWAEYLRIGICAIDPEHWLYGDYKKDRYEVFDDGQSRRCKYCGRVEVKRIKVIEKEVWVVCGPEHEKEFNIPLNPPSKGDL